MPSTMYQLADRVLDGRLQERLATWVAAGVTRRAATNLLNQELGVKLDRGTVDRWMREAAEQ